MQTKSQHHSQPGRKLALWGLMAALVLLLMGAGAQGSRGAGEQGSGGASEIGIISASLHRRAAAQSRTITFSYDRSGRLTSANYGDGVLLVYDYDPAGNLRRVTGHFDVFLPLIMR